MGQFITCKSLNEKQIADFETKTGTENIFGRITGGDASVINGLIKVTGSNANLYLMNPAGVVFGNRASLNVPSSFHATTASGIGFGDNWFKAFGENDYTSLVGNPDSFGFTQAGTILNSGNLGVEKGQITLLGGTVINTGTLKAPGGNITIKAVPKDKLVTIKQEGNLLSLGFPESLLPVTKEILHKNNQTFTLSSLPKLLTGGNLNNATGIEVENGVVKLTGSGTEIPDKAGTVVVNARNSSERIIGKDIDIQGENIEVLNAIIAADSNKSNLDLLATENIQVKSSVFGAENINLYSQNNLIIENSDLLADEVRINNFSGNSSIGLSKLNEKDFELKNIFTTGKLDLQTGSSIKFNDSSLSVQNILFLSVDDPGQTHLKLS